jgi:hypothetical protein
VRDPDGSGPPPAGGAVVLVGLAAGDAIGLFGLARLADAAKTMPAVWVTVLPGDAPCVLSGVLALVWGAGVLGLVVLAAVGHLRARGWTVRIRAP